MKPYMGTILIADGGSTKIHWAHIDGDCGDVREFFTSGVNPAVMAVERIAEIFAGELAGKLPGPVSRVEFYGAGCKGEAPCRAVVSALRPWVGEAEISVESDMLGACRALLGDEPGVACILGTGANSCLYDGVNIVANVSPGGYILGDEGSGAWLGRRLAGDVIKGLLPEELSEAFYAWSGLDATEIIRRVYRPASGEDAPNRFLASLAPFLSEHIDEKPLRGIVKEGITEFFERNVAAYFAGTPSAAMSVNFVGSVAVAFEELLRQTALELGYKVGTVVQSPMDALISRAMEWE